MEGVSIWPGIMIGTAILWVLNAVLVAPLTNWSLRRRMVAEGVDPSSIGDLSSGQGARWKGIATGYYILWDVIVLGIAGFIGGLLGFWFIGVSLDLKGWPGILAFIGASLFGFALSGAPGSL